MGVVIDAYSSEKEIKLIINNDTVVFSGGTTSPYLIRRDARREIQILLNDEHRKPILTLRPKRFSVRRRWEGFAGKGHGSEPIFSVRRSSVIGKSDLTAKVYGNPIAEKFRIKRLENRCFTIYDTGNRSMVAEKRWEGDDFVLQVMAGFDCAFAVGLMVVVDHIGGGL